MLKSHFSGQDSSNARFQHRTTEPDKAVRLLCWVRFFSGGH